MMIIPYLFRNRVLVYPRQKRRAGFKLSWHCTDLHLTGAWIHWSWQRQLNWQRAYSLMTVWWMVRVMQLSICLVNVILLCAFQLKMYVLLCSRIFIYGDPESKTNILLEFNQDIVFRYDGSCCLVIAGVPFSTSVWHYLDLDSSNHPKTYHIQWWTAPPWKSKIRDHWHWLIKSPKAQTSDKLLRMANTTLIMDKVITPDLRHVKSWKIWKGILPTSCWWITTIIRILCFHWSSKQCSGQHVPCCMSMKPLLMFKRMGRTIVVKLFFHPFWFSSILNEWIIVSWIYFQFPHGRCNN